MIQSLLTLHHLAAGAGHHLCHRRHVLTNLLPVPPAKIIRVVVVVVIALVAMLLRSTLPDRCGLNMPKLHP